jgi:hypothetical protein
MTDLPTKEGSRQRIEDMAQQFGVAFPGCGAGHSLSSLVQINLRLLVSVFGLLSHSVTCGELGFKDEDQVHEILVAMESLQKLSASVDIPVEDWVSMTDKVQLTELLVWGTNESGPIA